MTAAEGRVDVDPLAIARKRYALFMLSYPPSWRREHGEALLGTCLDAAADRRGRGPTMREGMDLLRHGLGWRLRLLAPAAQTRRIAAALALILGTAVAMTCFIIAEWQPGVSAIGWRLEPGHVGPFATLGPVIYAVWVAAFIATLAGRALAAHRLLIGSIVTALVVNGMSLSVLVYRIAGRGTSYPTPRFFDMNKPPGTVLVLLISLALIGCLGRLSWHGWERLLIALSTVALTGWMLAVAAPDGPRPVWDADQAYGFYRASGFNDLIRFQTFELTPLIVLVAALAWRWRPEWLPATLILSVVSAPFVSLPGAYLTLVDMISTRLGGPTLSSQISYAMLTGPLVLAALAATIWWRWRTGRPEPVRSTEVRA